MKWNPMANWFLAFPITGLNELLQELPKNPWLNVFHPQDLHLTCCFFGRMQPAQIKVLCEKLRQQELPAFELRVRAWLFLPKEQTFSAICLGFEAEPSFEKRIVELNQIFFPLCHLPIPTRKPLPHVTLARPKRNLFTDLKSSLKAEVLKAALPSQPIGIKRLALYTWTETRKPIRFKIICENRN